LPLASVPNLPASQITSGQLALARGGTNADLSATGGASQVVRQSSAGAAFTVGQLAFTDLSGSASVAQIPNLPASIITSGQLALARGGTNADLSGTGGASFVLKQTSVGAAITAAQLAFTEISGSVAASQLPNPTASTLGGIESYAAVSNQWINAISTSGVPSSAQPAFTDISGALAGAQMPTTFKSAGIGYFNALWGMGPPPTAGSNIPLTTAKLVYATQVLYPITVRNIVFKVNAPVAASKVYIALYDASGTLVPNSSNGGAAGTSIAVVSTALGTPFTINPGLYYVFVQADTTGITIDGNAFAATTDTVLNKNVTRVGTCANGISGAAVPGTLGVLTPVSNSIPQILFES